jgi:hypothetical protein
MILFFVDDEVTITNNEDNVQKALCQLYKIIDKFNMNISNDNGFSGKYASQYK